MTVTGAGRLAMAAVAALLAAACAAAAPAQPPALRFTAVALPGGAAPEVLAVTGDALLVGMRRGTAPGLLRRDADGTLAEVATRPSTPYGKTAAWYALAADGPRVLAVGGERGGAHGNVRWSVWTGTPTAVAERTQGFSTFGGWGAGDLVGAVLAPTGPTLVGSWQSDAAGLDVAVWTPTGDLWARRASTGTALASTRTTQGFATAAAPSAGGVLVAGWQVGGPDHPGQAPVVWSLDGPDPRGWVRTVLPEPGAAGVASAAACAAGACVVSGRVDGALALWRGAGGGWSRVADVPPVAVADTDPVAAPLLVDGRVLQVATDRGAPVLLDLDGPRVTRRPVAGPPGPVRAAAAVGSAVYVVAGDPAGLWRADLPAPS